MGYKARRNSIGYKIYGGTAPLPSGKNGTIFIKGFKNIDKLQFHRFIKPNILKKAGNYAKNVGKNPDIIVEKGEIILKGTGPFAKKTFNTGLKAIDFFK